LKEIKIIKQEKETDIRFHEANLTYRSKTHELAAQDKRKLGSMEMSSEISGRSNTARPKQV
jgi:hypothetical protein